MTAVRCPHCENIHYVETPTASPEGPPGPAPAAASAGLEGLPFKCFYCSHECRAASAGEVALRALETVLEFAGKWAESKRRDREALEEAEPILRAALAPAQREGK